MDPVPNTLSGAEPVAEAQRAVLTEQPRPRQWEPLALVPILAGLYWLLAQDGGAWLFWALVPGCILLSSGMALLFMPGDPRITAYMAAASVIGALFCLPAWLVADAGTAFFALLGSIGSFLAAGRVALAREPLYVGATSPEFSTTMDAKVALDEAVLGYFLAGIQLPSGEAAARTTEDALRMESVIKARGWDRDPAAFHPAPPPPDKTFVGKGRILGQDYETLSFESGYRVDEALPGARAWNEPSPNQQCHVRILRHPGGPRPWLLCIHGYRMGQPLLDFSLFSPGWLHHRLGVNVIQPVLPLHGPRSIGLRSGDHFLDGDPLDLLYAEGQAQWDLRRTLAWLRQTEDRPRVGAFGISLGGYNAALLSNLDTQLDFVIAGIPAVDFAMALWRFIPSGHSRFFEARGLTQQRYRELLVPVSPLSGAPRLERERLYILAATADRLVYPSHPLALAAHWGVPVTWYQGSHLSVRRERETREIVKTAMSHAGWR